MNQPPSAATDAELALLQRIIGDAKSGRLRLPELRSFRKFNISRLGPGGSLELLEQLQQEINAGCCASCRASAALVGADKAVV